MPNTTCGSWTLSMTDQIGNALDSTIFTADPQNSLITMQGTNANQIANSPYTV